MASISRIAIGENIPSRSILIEVRDGHIFCVHPDDKEWESVEHLASQYLQKSITELVLAKRNGKKYEPPEEEELFYDG